ncbi:hypothetical protein SULAZ_0877 [Sulfurihydrogenibium azorense Az-Fu1]|uniref:Uncharacterized protein n=1 Tax=Sulfurihydrogenibium azorense (strain DSM 15241 / OCM 825 / Az-Fu1) TaxID=204536 RepID=C1DUR8_SULAA|nr:hypothetical protein [Sulfurihydrogenibium azorense]ACN99305.1 hypothetical protein SULAZ_0877 [Sulfurihydrogenibium azorense Az-Fu1]
MGKVIIETVDERELQIKTSLTTDQIEKILKDFEEKRKAEIALEKLKGILNTDKSAEEIIREPYEKIYGR